MSESTDFFNVFPILSVGLLRKKRIAILPFYHVEVYQGTSVKRIFVNYTFEANGKFESEIGGMKMGLFQAIQPSQKSMIIPVTIGTVEEMSQHIQSVLYKAENGSRLLFVWGREYNDDKPFFKALQLVEGLQSVAGLVTLQSLGLSIQEPYIENTATFK